MPCVALILGYGGLHAFYDRTLGFQASRGSPFSVWGLYGWDTAQAIVQGAAVVVSGVDSAAVAARHPSNDHSASKPRAFMHYSAKRAMRNPRSARPSVP